ncbi:MAG: hypothetical protein ACPLZG_09275, partial [Thermoproteota archaeon]
DFFINFALFLRELPRDPLGAISKYILTPVSTFVAGLPFIKDYVVPFIKGVKESFDSLIKDPQKWLNDNILKPISDFINNTPIIRDYVFPIIKNFALFLAEFPKDPLGALSKYVLTPVSTFISNLPFIKDYVVPFVSKIIEEFKKAVSDPIGYIKNLFDSVISTLSDIASKVVGFLGQLLASVPTSISKYLTGLWNSAVGFIGGIGEPLVNIGKAFLDSVLSPIINMLKNSFSTVANIGLGFLSAGLDVVGSLTEPVGKIFMPILEKVTQPVGSGFATWFEDSLSPKIEKLRSGWTPQGELYEVLLGIGGLPLFSISASTLARTYYVLLHLIGDHLPDVNIGVTVGYTINTDAGTQAVFQPLSVGALEELRAELGYNAVTPIVLGINPKWFFKTMASEIKELPMELTRDIMQAYTIWMLRPLSRYSASLLRDMLVVELPPLELLTEVLRRHMVYGLDSDNFKKTMDDMLGFFRLYGYSTKVIDWMTKQDIMFSIKDRFGNERKIPIALFFELPSPSDVATMYVRDIFPSPEEFFKFYRARGMADDVGVLYYFLRFRYPPPEKLWQFTVRGISGLLWASIPDAEKPDLEKEAKGIGAPLPIDAYKLNFKSQELLSALRTYMKWHDYFRLSWIPNFTSDNQIIIDTLADIPTKIDQRWMVRFGLYEHLSEKGVERKSEIKEFRTKVLEDSSASEIQMDLTNFCRTLQATGLHPDYVPLTAVAETIMAVSDERTLLRAGALNLFKEGFWTLDSLQSLFDGALTVSFKVSAFDYDTNQWVDDKWINVPLRFLPAEASLINLRASMDRVLDILRELQRDVSNAYADNILVKYDDFKNTLTEMINDLNTTFSDDYKKIVGKDMPNELKLTYVDKYFEPLTKALEVAREIYIVRRIRAWTQRWIGWLMYRLATGVTKKEDFEKFVNTVAEASKLTDDEREFLKKVTEQMGDLAVREYIPTPSQLATLSEYIVIPSSFVDEAFEKRLVPKEWQSLWRKYIEIRPVADDVRALISTYMYVNRYIKLPDDVKNKVTAYASEVGYTKKELEILDFRAQLEELLLDARQNVREYIPTPMTLATLSEYVPEVRTFFDDVMKAKKVPKEWQEVWSKYLDIRPLVDDIKRYLSRAEELYARFMLKEDEFLKVLNDVKERLGYTDEEAKFLLLTTKYERYRNAWTELIGTVEKMVTVAEYSPVARDYAIGKLNEMIDALPISNEEKNKLKEMWKQYIRVRPVYDEVRRYVTDLINAFVDGTISDATLSSELESLKQWGLGDDEIMFYKAMAGLRRARKLKIVIG